MAGPEPSEVFAAAAMCFDSRYLDIVVSEGITYLIDHFFEEAQEKVKKYVVFPSGGTMTKSNILSLFKAMEIIISQIRRLQLLLLHFTLRLRIKLLENKV